MDDRSLPLVNFSVNRRVTITMFILIIVTFGLLSLSRLGLDMLPDITYPVVSVVTQYAGVAPEEIEELLTRPMEGMIAGVNGVKNISSQSAEGISAINVEFEWGTNLDYAAQDIKDNIDMIRDFLPDDITEPVVFKFNLSQMPIMFIGVTGPHDSYEIRTILEDNVRDRLQRLDGVAQAAVYGEKMREIRVSLNPARVRERGLDVNGIVQALAMQNMNTPAGYFTRDNTDFLFRAVGQFENMEDIENAVVGASPDGTPVSLHEVARVEDTFKEQRNRIRMDGNESVFLVINKLSGANTLRVSQRVNAELDRIKSLYPKLSFIEIFDQGTPVQRITSATSWNAIVGGILAIGFMLIFLLNIRPTLTIAVAIPLSIITTFIAIYASGFTLNLMTLGGLALGVGMLVDNAVVVIENIYRHLEHGTHRKDAARRGASEVALAISASTLTTVVVFLPILFSQGLAAQLFRGVALTIIFSLLASLFVALTIVPMLASVFFKERRTKETAAWFAPIRRWYTDRLRAALDHHVLTTLTVAVVLVLSLAAGATFLGKEFMPEADGGRFVLKVQLPVGTTLEETSRLTARIREEMVKMPEVITVGEIIGRSETERGGDQAAITGPHEAQIFVRLTDADTRERDDQQIQEAVRSRLPKLENTRYTFMNMGMMSGDEKPINVRVYGKDLGTLRSIADRVAEIMGSVEGLRDIESSFAKGRPEYHFVLNRRKALRLGLMPAQVQQAIETANLGRIATRLRTGEDEIDVRVIVDERFREDLDRIGSIPLRAAGGASVPLRQVVEIRRREGPLVIRRDNKLRVGVVDANLVERDLASAVEEIKEKIGRIRGSLPSGYSVSFKGQFEDMQETFRDLGLALAIAVLLVYMVMASLFESLTHPFVVLTTFPLSIIGVVWILLATGKTFSVVAFIGVIILCGIVVNNGIVMIDFVNHLRREGLSVKDALVRAGETRVRPVLITAGTTIMGMLPMALSRSEGSELRAPMSLTVIGGLLSATVLTLVVVPIAYFYIDRIGEWFKGGIKRIVG